MYLNILTLINIYRSTETKSIPLFVLFGIFIVKESSMKYKITKKHIRNIIKEYVDDYADELLRNIEPEKDESHKDKFEVVEEDFRGVMTDFLKKHSHKFEDGKWSVISVVDHALDKWFK